MFGGNQTGIIYNNQMYDFSIPGEPNLYGLPPSSFNMIVPGKRPTSSMSPIIILDQNDDIRLVLGASGGSRIISAVSTVSFQNALLLLLFIVSSLILLSGCHQKFVPESKYQGSNRRAPLVSPIDTRYT